MKDLPAPTTRTLAAGPCRKADQTSGGLTVGVALERLRRHRKRARRMPDEVRVSTSASVALFRNSATSREEAGRRRGSSTRSITRRKAISSGGKRMTPSAAPPPPPPPPPSARPPVRALYGVRA